MNSSATEYLNYVRMKPEESKCNPKELLPCKLYLEPEKDASYEVEEGWDCETALDDTRSV